MSASNQDIALTIISDGKSAYFSSVKGIGNIIWDARLGIFNNQDPIARKALKFIKGGAWEECVDQLKSPLANPVYGTIEINFDTKKIQDDNGYSESTCMLFEWLLRSVHDVINRKEGLIPKESLLDHFRSGRIQLYAGNNAYGEPLKFSDLASAYTSLCTIKEVAWEEDRKHIGFARLILPSNWTYQNKNNGLNS